MAAPGLPSLSAAAPRERMPRRLVQLVLGVALLGAATGLLVRARLGLAPWAVLHQGLAVRLDVSLGTTTIGVGLLLLLAWIPLRERPGIGTVANVVLVGLAVDVTLAVVPPVDALAARIGLAVAGVVLTSLAIAAYIGVRLGPGPRDGLMTALVRRTSRSIRLVRTSMEVVVLATGFLLGGTVGVATVLLVVTIGPLTQLFVTYLVVHLPTDAPAVQARRVVRHDRRVDPVTDAVPDVSAQIDDAALERVAALGWPGLEQARLGDWLLRASAGFTGRGNSVLPVGDPGRPQAEAIAAVVGWYRERGMPPLAQVPLPLCAVLDDELDRRGWRAFNRSAVLTGPVALLLPAAGGPTMPKVRLERTPSPDWLRGYHYRGAALPEVAADVLAAGVDPVFASVELDGAVVAVGRGIVDAGWLGVTAVTVAETHRRLGLGSAIMAALAGWALERGGHSVYLQVAGENTAAMQMYERLGIRRHHEYQYRKLDG